MTDLRVPTTRQPVTITCTDGRSFDGDIFMPSQSSRHQGPMRPEEWSDAVPTFFPFRARDAVRSIVFNVGAVVAFTTPACAGQDAAAAQPFDDARGAGLPVARMTVDASGTSFEGHVVIDMPPDRQRVADLLNAPGAFIIVRGQGRLHLIHKRHITRVLEMPESGR